LNERSSVTCSNCQAALGSAQCQTHPERLAASACARCGTFVCEQCVDPASGRCAACAKKVGGLPWDERASLGVWVGWWRTSVAMISRPTQTLTQAAAEAPLGSSLLFAVISSLVGVLPTVLVYVLVLLPLALDLAPDAKLPIDRALLPVAVAASMLLMLAVQVAVFFAFTALDQLGLKLFGAKPKSFEVSARAQALSMAPYLLGLIPLCGFSAFPIWAVVLRVVGLARLHQVSAGRAAAAVLVPLLLLCGVCGFGYLAMLAAAFSDLPNQR
jgi:hypothetical protein